ncbi:MAG TPA: MFS transporter [Candidatus Dormibacteraeota bacterium]|nr:MFS transporter [Candidatus Dormibacteraeota bacterium]
MGAFLRASRVTFAALSIPNFRRYASGQSISMVGTWMQTTAQSWLVLTLTHSALDLGLVVATQTLPVLVLGAYGGVIADRVEKRRLMVFLQTMMGIQAAVLGILTLAGVIQIWEIFILAALLGLNNTFENPSRQAFMMEMVGAKDLRNAVSLNTVLVNVARAIGPAVAGLLIASVGIGWCFIINAASFIAVVASLVTMDLSLLRPSRKTARARGQLREGFRYVAGIPEMAVPLLMMAVVGTLAYEFQVVLPVMASHTFQGGAKAYGFMTASMGIGAIGGGLVTAARGRTGLRPVAIAAGVFGLVLLMAAAAPTLTFEYIALAVVGWASISFIARGNSTLQLTAAPRMRGRVMALWVIAFQGTTPIGGPLIGWVTSTAGPRVALATGGVSCLVAAGVGVIAIRHRRTRAGHAQVAAAAAAVDAVDLPNEALG